MPGTYKRQTVDYSDFSAGEFGDLGSWNAPKGSFTGQNVVRYVDGSLGPRNGLKALTVTGLPASGVGNRMGLDPNGNLFFQVGTVVYTIDGTDTSSQAATSVGDAVVTLNQGVQVGADYVYAISSSAGIKRLDFTTPAVTSVASSPNGRYLIQYGERTLAAGDNAQPQRLYYSDAGDPESWPASNFIDVGTGTTIKAMLVLRSGVAIYTVASAFSGIDGRWWILTGVPGVNDSLREVLRATQGPLSDADACLSGNGVVVFAASTSEVIGSFDGSNVRLIRHLSLGTLSVLDYRAATPLRDESDVLVVSQTDTASSCVGFVRRDGTWVYQAFSEADVGNTIATRDGTLPSNIAPVSRAQNLVFFVTDASPPVFYIWAAYNDRPPFSTDYSASVLAPANVNFTLPEWWARDGEEVSVRKVIVQFRDWDTDDSDDNQFDVQVTPLRQYEGGAGTVQTKSFSRATSASAAAGVNLRREWNFSQDWGNGFTVGVANMRGVAIQKIQVVLDVRAVQAV